MYNIRFFLIGDFMKAFSESKMDFDMNIGQEYTKDEIQETFHTKFGHSIKGINLRIWKEDGTPYILLFSSVHGPYTDEIDENIWYYDGEGKNKDQELTDANKALITSNETNRTIYGFRKKEKGKWIYVGVLEVLNYDYVMKNGFKTYVFKLKRTELDLSETITSERKEIIQSVENKPQLTNNTIYDNMKRKRRNAAFSKLIKEEYNYSCVVCGSKRFTNSGHPEVEAAHIYPKSKDGADDLRNGICLCKLHHWAFDNGLFSVRDDFSIIVDDRIKDDVNYKEIYDFENLKIKIPNNKKIRPDPLYLTEHRKIHGFDLQE